MPFELDQTDEAKRQLAVLEADKGQARVLKAVRKALGLLQREPNHPGLNVHPFKGETCPHGGTLFEAYAQNNTPAAWRIFFCYPPNAKGRILIVAITPHP
jgi:hypothetical protein